MVKPSPSLTSAPLPTVLVVDDELPIRQQLAVALAQRGYASELAENSVQALERLESARLRGEPHHCLVLDLRLPDIEGLRLLQVIKATYPETRVIVISGYGHEYETRTIEHYDDCSYLDKPFDLDALCSEIARFEVRDRGAARPLRPPAALHARSAYVFLRTRSAAELDAVVDRLSTADGVCYCDVVQGDWDLALLVQAEDAPRLDLLVRRLLSSAPGVDQHEVHVLTRPLLSDELTSFIRNHERMLLTAAGGEEARLDRRRRQQLSAYVLVGLDPNALRTTYPQLYFHPRVLYCDVTADQSEVILFVHALSSDDLRRTVLSLQGAPGVRRTQQLTILEGHD